MLRSIAKAFEFKETSISKGKLRRILTLMLLSLPTWPLFLADYYNLLPDNIIGTAAMGVIILGVISMFLFVSTRFVNRFYFPDKYLDEWEIKIKHKSMTFAFMVFVWVASPVMLVLMMTRQFSGTVSGEAMGLWGMGLLLGLLYLQTFHALWQVRPIDDDELA